MTDTRAQKAIGELGVARRHLNSLRHLEPLISPKFPVTMMMLEEISASVERCVKFLEEEAFQVWVDEHRQPQALPPGEPAAMWLIRYADTEIADEGFFGEEAERFARRRFEQQRGAWTISLFCEVTRG